MKYLAVICLLFAVASAGLIHPTHLVRTPSLDSAVIKSERLGGNFAYSSVEGHSYAAISPVIQHVATPVAVSYHAHAPVVTGVTAHVGAPTLYASHHYAHAYPLHYPLGFAPAVIGEAPVAAPVAAPEADAPVEAAPAPAADVASDTVEVEAA